jgi:hypothetical protein
LITDQNSILEKNREDFKETINIDNSKWWKSKYELDKRI